MDVWFVHLSLVSLQLCSSRQKSTILLMLSCAWSCCQALQQKQEESANNKIYCV